MNLRDTRGVVHRRNDAYTLNTVDCECGEDGHFEGTVWYAVDSLKETTDDVTCMTCLVIRGPAWRTGGYP